MDSLGTIRFSFIWTDWKLHVWKVVIQIRFIFQICHGWYYLGWACCLLVDSPFRYRILGWEVLFSLGLSRLSNLFISLTRTLLISKMCLYPNCPWIYLKSNISISLPFPLYSIRVCLSWTIGANLFGTPALTYLVIRHV